MNEPFLLNFDSESRAVLEPDHEQEINNFHFQPKLLFAFLTPDVISSFLARYPHKKLGFFDCFEGETPIYQVDLDGQKITFCQAKIGAAAAVELLDWLISYGVKQILAIGSAGCLVDLPENYFLVPTRAIRDEGTSFHYMKPGTYIDLKSEFLTKTKKLLSQEGFKVEEVTTWTTDGFFRETVKKVKQAKELGASSVEMECAAMAACAQFREADFAQILFTADSLKDIENHDDRGWGRDAHEAAINLAANIISKI
ncbi:nucleoside phosphorylase [Lactobacillus sp. M0398]|uniref:nucleoside phosphorylase n=1 Tax=unclassified Lactobacillus TaxID=2620435 RepID=UPI0018DDD02B|nr:MULTISPECIES: nucleoside phosphorylase [unclassified Lactobacillus]MBI0121621.1 nucleoside phosphorylase [Lactobacillus sp. M0398]MBI0122300.1 nucleoside phosphorylase [Lactobacillus sp. W8174]MBI0134636.1 nucleoside phosphorylase [Lactobacillus sp. W8173]